MQCWIAVTPPLDADHSTRSSLSTYTYETNDRSKKQIAANDLLFLRDQKRLLAVAHVESVSTEKRERVVPTCPVCGVTKVEMRKKRDIPYRCFNGHQFAEQAEVRQMTIVHTAFFAHECVKITAPIEPSELRPFETTNSKHIKLKLADITGLCGYVARRDHNIAPILRSWLRSRTLELGERDADTIEASPLSVMDEQDRPFQAIRARRGVASFREKLINRYGARCMISGCNVLGFLEACHVSKYQGTEDNHPANGILLRSDLHTLFDLDLIGINPADMSVTIHADLLNTEYQKFAGTRILPATDKGIDMRAVRSRWEQFVRRLSTLTHHVALITLCFQLLALA